jgi:nitrite reductase (NADH) large subunit
VPDGCYGTGGYELRLGEAATAIDRAARTVTTSEGLVLRYDALVLATGSYPFVPPVPGADLPGCFVYRTVEDVAAIRSFALARAGDRDKSRRAGLVVGGGLLGLEAARALRLLGMSPHVVELAPRLMPLQVDEAVYAIGECACAGGRVYGLVAPG